MAELDKKSDLGTDQAAQVRYWCRELETAEKKREDSWRKKADKVIKRYKDERDDLDKGVKFNILWSNTETLKPALYSATPKPDVRRRFVREDDIARQGATVLERSLASGVDAYDFDAVLQASVFDYLLPGRGVAVVRYEYEAAETLIGLDEFGVPEFSEEVVYEEAKCVYWPWKDFLHSYGRVWDEVTWIALRSHMTMEAIEERFGEELARLVHMADEDIEEKDKKVVKTYPIYEIWDKDSGTQIFLSPGLKGRFLERNEDPLGLEGFFPCPRPLLSFTTTDSLIPTPEFCFYQDQAEELDRVTARINKLVNKLQAKGLYSSTLKEIDQLYSEGDNTLVPVAVPQDMDLDKAISYWPIERIAQVLLQLYQNRDSIKQTIYELTGISDIIRGASMASETATAQRIKGQFAALRLESRKKEVARFARDLIRLKAEVIAEHFSPKTLKALAGEELFVRDIKTPQGVFKQDITDQVMQLIQAQYPRTYRIDIETDSTIMADDQLNKQAHNQFLQVVAPLLQQIVPAIQSGVLPGDVGKALLMFGIRPYKEGRELEDALEALEVFEADGQPQQQEQGPSEAEIKMQTEMKKIEANLMAKMKEIESKQQVEVAKVQADDRQHQRQIMMEDKHHAEDLAQEREEAVMDVTMKTNIAAMQERGRQISEVREAAYAPGFVI